MVASGTTKFLSHHDHHNQRNRLPPIHQTFSIFFHIFLIFHPFLIHSKLVAEGTGEEFETSLRLLGPALDAKELLGQTGRANDWAGPYLRGTLEGLQAEGVTWHVHVL